MAGRRPDPGVSFEWCEPHHRLSTGTHYAVSRPVAATTSATAVVVGRAVIDPSNGKDGRNGPFTADSAGIASARSAGAGQTRSGSGTTKDAEDVETNPAN